MRYTTEIREQIDRCIKDADNAGFTIQGTIDFIRDKTGILIGRNQIFQRRNVMRKISRNSYNKYRSDNFAYKLEYIDGMNRVKRIRDIAYSDIIKYENDEKKVFFKHKSSYVFLDADKRYLEYLDRLPEIDTVGQPILNEMEQQISELESRANREVGNTQSEAIF